MAKLEKEQNLQNRKSHAHQTWFYAFHFNLYLHEFFQPILFLTPMDSPWSKGKFCLFWRQLIKGQNLQNQKGYAHQNWFPCISHQPLFAWIFWGNSIFWPPWTIVHGPKGNFGRFWRQVTITHDSCDIILFTRPCSCHCLLLIGCLVFCEYNGTYCETRIRPSVFSYWGWSW